jgi:uncharacterized protein YdhG (YjbR/CyaY superfamily)
MAGRVLSRKRRVKALPNAKATRAQVDAYIAALPPAARRTMQTMRAAIRAAAPRAVEHFSYRIPGYRLDGRPLVWYGAFPHHTSMYPMTAGIRRALAADIERYETSTGTIRFPLDNPPSPALIRKLVKARIAEMRASRR